MIKNYFKTAWRNLFKNKVYSIINITGLSIGIAVCMLITLFVKDEFSFDQYQKNKKEIYRLVVTDTGNNQKSTYGITGMVHGSSFKKQIPELQNMVCISGIKLNIKHNNDVLVQDASYTDSNFFKMFTADFIEGNGNKALSDPYSIVISEDVAKRFFGNSKALGQTLEIAKKDTFKLYTVAGVTKNSPRNSSIQINLLMPFDYENNHDNQWLNFYLNTFFTVREQILPI
jgi:putative ABC transport system permease protein